MGSINQHFIQQHPQIMAYQKILLATATILLFAVSSQAFKISTRDYCPPKPTTMSTFNATQFLGNWYQVNGLPAFFSPEGTTCIRATYGAMDYGKVSVRNVDFNPAGKFVVTQMCQIQTILQNSLCISPLLQHLITGFSR